MENLEFTLQKKCPSLYEYFRLIKDFSIHHWDKAPVILRHFTEHGISHTKKILEYIEDLIHTCTPPLNPDELYVLLSSAYLHDISMQFPQYVIKKEITKFNDNDYEKIRINHRKTIIDVIKNDLFDYFKKHSHHKHFPYHSYISRVCEDHRANNIGKDFLEAFRVIGGESIRIRLLTALLQCADALHITENRISSEMKPEILPLQSQKYWWKNYYVREVLIDDRFKRISVHYVVPTQFLKCMNIFIRFAELNLKGYPGDALDVLWDHGIRFRVGGHEPWILIDDRKIIMPNNVFEDIENLLNKVAKENSDKYFSLIENNINKQLEFRILEEIRNKGKVNIDSLSELIPYITKETIENICNNLKEKKMIIIKKHRRETLVLIRGEI